MMRTESDKYMESQGYTISEEVYTAERSCNNHVISGYLVKDKDYKVDGLLSFDHAILNWIKPETLKLAI